MPTECVCSPVPGRNFCWRHVRDADMWGSDLAMRSVMQCFEAVGTDVNVVPNGSELQPLLALCRRAHRPMRFVLQLAQNEYPVTLVPVQTIPRSRKYTFRSSLGRQFVLTGLCAPVHHILSCTTDLVPRSLFLNASKQLRADLLQRDMRG